MFSWFSDLPSICHKQKYQITALITILGIFITMKATTWLCSFLVNTEDFLPIFV